MSELGSDLSFTFLRPIWLIALALLPLIGWAIKRARARSGWEQYIPAAKLKYLEIESSEEQARRQSLLLIGLALAVLALAGPSWRELPVPVGQSRDAMIIAFDLSPSMLATDLSPDRLTRSRLKVIDLLRRRQEGETALIAYSGGAHRVAPLTDDSKTIEVLVPSLHPSVMPAAGSEVEAAVAMASELLAGASLERATLVLITDGIDQKAFDPIAESLSDRLDLCVLLVGTDEKVPIPLPGGGFLRDTQGQTLLTRIDHGAIRRFVESTGGCFAELRSDDADLDSIMRFAERKAANTIDASDRTFDLRQDEGFWLVLALLPFALIAFRKNVLWIGIIALSTATPDPAHAAEGGWSEFWQNTWQRPDQRLAQQVSEGVELYREGRYSDAAERFSGSSDISLYNRGNALALQGQLEEAIKSYAAALEGNPDFDDAAHNKRVVEDLLQEQEQEQQQQQQQDQDPNQDPSQGNEPQDSEGSKDSEEAPSESSKEDSSRESEDNTDPENEQSSPDSAPEEEEAQANDPTEAPEPTPQPSPSEPEEEQEEPGEASEVPSSESEQTPLSDQSEQWLRHIPDDPGGLLRRKFQYEAELRRRSGQRNAPQERY